MEKLEIAKYYYSLDLGRRSRFLTVLHLQVGDAPDTWRHNLKKWSEHKFGKRSIGPAAKKRLEELIEHDLWDSEFDRLSASY